VIEMPRSARTPVLLRTVAVALLAAVAVALLACGSDAGSTVSDGPARAAIVDQLSLSHPNAAFVEDATDQLVSAGYQVDYYPGDQVTVDLYRQLAEHDYEYVVFRVHIARFEGEWRGKTYDQPVLFTTEPYDPDVYVDEQWDLLLNPVFAFAGAPKYFGVAPNFIEDIGDYDGATVVLMGCSGMSTDALAAAFEDRGAARVVGWSDLVSAEHTDAATTELLGYLLEGSSAEEAVEKTNGDVGPDPIYDSRLLAYAP
jgi:hypothetical protein